jgi:hypothetical protein
MISGWCERLYRTQAWNFFLPRIICPRQPLSSVETSSTQQKLKGTTHAARMDYVQIRATDRLLSLELILSPIWLSAIVSWRIDDEAVAVVLDVMCVVSVVWTSNENEMEQVSIVHDCAQFTSPSATPTSESSSSTS